MQLPKAVRNAIEQFEKLPGIGPKSAQRIVFYLLHHPQTYLEEFGSKLTKLKLQTAMCERCHNVGEENPCEICSDPTRDQTKLMVLEQPFDILAIERSEKYHGLYHVLHGVIAPLNNIGPEQLFIYDISKRLNGPADGGIKVDELILATNPTMEGEATALFIQELVQSNRAGKPPIKITRIGHGLPIGADIEYADGLTLARALEGRREM
jgi:recombination protein RecR